ncbi:hypothetical protein [Sphingomonas sanxanigenens]|uniref:Uncharacterized protein n=1 Tax=Sphingomonas sanxanigenens DSM 19645 = NX02 TaxID=1123269 RepID=W0A695_9SPHN|nr:hypothetical protein [Sphingomonas sanxanigenens]AHE51868.1 hypothetical protein NX02_00500 [Sphingomonas sanxanigenens DSM 19645 = NX02]
MLGFMLAPVPVLLCAWSNTLWLTKAMGGHENPANVLLLVSVPIYAAVALLGLPMHLALNWIERRGLIHHLLAGLILSSIIAIGPVLGGEGDLALRISLLGSVLFFTVLTVILFWLIAVWQPRWPSWPSWRRGSVQDVLGRMRAVPAIESPSAIAVLMARLRKGRGGQKVRWTRVLRVSLGFLLAPIPMLLLFWSTALLYLGTFGRHEDPNKVLLMVPVWTYGLSVLIGIPIHVLLQRKGWRGIAHYLVAGVILSMIMACFGLGLEFSLFGLFTSFMLYAHLITVTVLLFWLIAVWQPGKTIRALRAAFHRRRPSHG